MSKMENEIMIERAENRGEVEFSIEVGESAEHCTEVKQPCQLDASTHEDSSNVFTL